MTDRPASRRRRRSDRPADPTATAALSPAAAELPADEPRRTKAPRSADERGWRDLAGNSPSQLGVSGALRARDVARPSEADLIAAEAELAIVHRQWQPPSE